MAADLNAARGTCSMETKFSVLGGVLANVNAARGTRSTVHMADNK